MYSATARDERFNRETLIPAMETAGELNLIERLLYSFFIIPRMRDEIQTLEKRFDWWYDVPEVGPGRWIAFVSTESGEAEIYVQAYPEPRGRWMVSTAGGDKPVWSRDGTELFYPTETGELMAVEVEAGDTFRAGTPRKLFSLSLKGSLGSTFDVAPDGERFLLNAQTVADTTHLGATLILHWARVL